MATKKKTVGRPKSEDPVKVRYIYLNNAQVKKIQGNYKDLTKAVVAKCG